MEARLTLHDETLLRLAPWRQNFLLLYNLTIVAAGSESLEAEELGTGKFWRFKFSASLAGWAAQYKGRTHTPSRMIQRYDLTDWIKNA